MTRFILATVAVVLTGFIFFAYQSKAEKPVSVPTPRVTVSVSAPEMKSVLKVKPKAATKIVVNSYETALAASKAENKRVVLYFTAPSWCPPCQKMEKYVLCDSRVKHSLESYIFYKIDIDGNERNVAKKWQVESVPTYVITDGEETAYKVGGGYKSVESFITWLTVEPTVCVHRRPILRAAARVVTAPVRLLCGARPHLIHRHRHVYRERVVYSNTVIIRS